MAQSPETAGQTIAQATRALAEGDRAAAERSYRRAQQQGLQQAVSWSNLAALGIGLGDAAAARAHAQRALQIDRSCVDAWVNFGVASWMLGQRHDAAQAMQRALQLQPGHRAAALNGARMQQSIGQYDEARAILQTAAEHAPQELKLVRALAEIARLQMDHPGVRMQALRALRLQADLLDPTQSGRSGLRAPAGADLRGALAAACDALEALGVSYHLMAGTLLAIVKDGRLFPHDKDVDLALPDLAGDVLQAVRAAFAADPAFRLIPAAGTQGERPTVLGMLHVATGIGVDLMLPQRDPDGRVHNLSGWPDQLVSILRPYAIAPLHWDGRDWPIPHPPAKYLADMYGEDWNEQCTVAAGIAYDRCYADTMLSNPSRTADSVPRAVNLGLLRLLYALDRREWSKAVAYCAQLLAREELPEVRAILGRLQAAGHDGMRPGG